MAQFHLLSFGAYPPKERNTYRFEQVLLPPMKRRQDLVGEFRQDKGRHLHNLLLPDRRRR